MTHAPDQMAIASFMGSALGISLFLVGILDVVWKIGYPTWSRLICKMTWGLRFSPGIRVTCPGDAKAVAAKAEERLGRGLGRAKITNDTLIVFFWWNIFRGVTREGNNELRSRCVLLVWTQTTTIGTANSISWCMPPTENNVNSLFVYHFLLMQSILHVFHQLAAPILSTFNHLFIH